LKFDALPSANISKFVDAHFRLEIASVQKINPELIASRIRKEITTTERWSMACYFGGLEFVRNFFTPSENGASFRKLRIEKIDLGYPHGYSSWDLCLLPNHRLPLYRAFQTSMSYHYKKRVSFATGLISSNMN